MFKKLQNYLKHRRLTKFFSRLFYRSFHCTLHEVSEENNVPIGKEYIFTVFSSKENQFQKYYGYLTDLSTLYLILNYNEKEIDVLTFSVFNHYKKITLRPQAYIDGSLKAKLFYQIRINNLKAFFTHPATLFQNNSSHNNFLLFIGLGVLEKLEYKGDLKDKDTVIGSRYLLVTSRGTYPLLYYSEKKILQLILFQKKDFMEKETHFEDIKLVADKNFTTLIPYYFSSKQFLKTKEIVYLTSTRKLEMRFQNKSHGIFRKVDLKEKDPMPELCSPINLRNLVLTFGQKFKNS